MAKVLNGETDTASGPSAWVLRWIGQPAGSATLLDFACGTGRHVGPALAAGYRVFAADRDREALARVEAAGGRVIACDLEGERWPFADLRFELVLMTRYLHRERLALLLGLVEPGGRFIGETFARGNERWGRPRNPAFLLEPDELFLACRRAGLTVLAFEQGAIRQATLQQGPASVAHPAVIQRVFAIRPPFDPLIWHLGCKSAERATIDPLVGR